MGTWCSSTATKPRRSASGLPFSHGRAASPLDESHGTDYERIFGRRRSDLENDEVEEVLREAIFQETDVEQIDQLDAETDGRELSVAFSGTLYSGQTISMEVTQ